MSKALDKVRNVECPLNLLSPKPDALRCSSNKLAGATSLLDPLLSCLGELLGTHEAWDRAKFSLAEHLGEALQ